MSARVAIIDLAAEIGCYKQTIFKVLRRLGIMPQDRRDPERGNQITKTVSATEAEAIRAELRRPARLEDNHSLCDAGIAEECRVFYVVQLEPEHDPRRVRVGFGDLKERLRKHRSSAPFARVVKTWPCRRTWERAAIDCITNGYEQLGGEVFRTTSVEEIVSRAEKFFGMLPLVNGSDQ